jgi:CheY-like chemotaxis protein/putative methionine-R-sulfoxide reductase with GAF domain
MALKMKNSISTSLGIILATCLLVVLGGGLITLLKQSSDQGRKQAEENVRETKEILLKSIHFAMGEGIDSAEPFARMFREISNIRDVRVTPTAAIDAEREANMDMNERDVVRSHKPQFFSEEYMGEEVIRVIDPLIAEPGCLECHDAKVGDPLAVVSMRYSLEETNASLRVQTILATIIVVVCIVITFVVMMFLINKRIIVDLKRIIEALKKFAVGNVKDSITTDRKDELGDAVKSLRVLQNNLLGKSEVATEIAKGNLDVKVKILSEEDDLGLSMQKMRDNIQTSMTEIERQNWLKSGISSLNDQMRGELEIKTLAQNVITYLTKYSDAQIGAIYLRDGDDTFDLIGSYAFNRRKGNKNEIKLGEGLVGQAALEKQTIIFNDIPDDYIKVNSGLGESPPKNIIVSPLVYEDKISGVIEVGSTNYFDDNQMEFFKQVSENIAIAINSAESRTRTQELLEQTQQQAEELQSQQEELRVTNEELQSQQEELRVTNEELEEQAKALKASEEEMRHKQEDLLTANEALEKQKKEIESKNTDLEVARKQVEEKAEQLELTSKYKSEFLANMSHELRTPMNSIQILSKLLADNKDGNLNNKQIEFAHTIHSSGTDLLELINDILDLSKIEAGKMMLNLGDMTLSHLPNYLTKNFEHVVAEKGLYLKINKADDIPAKIVTDRQRVEQILKNLLSNAIKFTEQGGITVELAKVADDDVLENDHLNRNETIKISVIDTGIGIPEDKQKLIFEAFQQADGTTSRKFGGTGLGLSISRELAKMLKGEMQLKSVPGKGSTFSIFLPYSISEELSPEIVETDEEIIKEIEKQNAPAETKPIVERKVNQIRDDRHDLGPDDETILVVDDDPRFAAILFDLVREKGFKCILAEDGEAGLQMANQYKPSAIILDVGLPRIDGWTVMERLKKSRETRHIPVYFISAHDQKLDAMKMGAIGYLTKPVSQESLDNAFDKIKSIISRDINKILIVEDDKDMRKSIEELLKSENAEIQSIDKGKEALKILEKEEFDCMVLDLGLKDISGFQLLDNIKSKEKFRDLPIIIYTGRELENDEEKKLRKHAESIIIKGAKSPERLIDEVSLFLHHVESDLPDAKKGKTKVTTEKDMVFNDKKILLVDDDVRNIFALSSVLGEKDMEITIAENGKEALKKLEENSKFDLVLMDIMMPEMDGYEAMRQIRKKQQFKNLPIIALTAKAMKGDRQKCIEAGASDYLSKPIDIEKLLSLMQVWLYK